MMSIQQSNTDFSSAGRISIHARSFLPWLILGLGLLLTFGTWHLSNNDITSTAQKRFNVRAAQIVTAVEQRMHAYEQVLRGGVGLLRTAPTTSRQQWHEYVANADMPKNYPGIQNMAVDFPITAVQKVVHIATIRAEGHADYSIRPEQPERPVYHSLVYVEPFGGRNLRAFGLDMYTNEVRRRAMDRAIDSGLPSMSGMVQLAQETNEDVQHGFIYCLPVYHADRPAITPEQRRAALRALVCGAFRANDLMRGIFGNRNGDLDLQIFDEVITPTSLLYGSRANDKSTIGEFSGTTPVEIGGRTWQLRVSANQAYVDSVSFAQSWLLAVAGVTLSGLLFGLMRSMFKAQLTARRIAVTLNSIGDAVVATDAGARVTLLNPLAEKLTGWRQGEAMGLPVDEVIRIIHEGTRLPAVNPVRDVLTHGTAHSLANHTLIVARDGSECAIADSCAPILDGEGKVAGSVLVFRDVTQENATRRALRDQQFYNRSLLEASIDALVTTDPNGMITDVNRQMETLTGFTRDELIGAPIKNFFTDPQLAEASIQLALAQKKLTNYELTVRDRDGRETVVSYNATTFYDRNGKLQGVFAAARDVTELKQFERSLQEKNVELQHATRMKSEFLATMSHELRTPLNAIIGFSEALKDGLIGELSDTQKEYIGDIFSSGQHLLSLINDILDLSKVEAGMMTLELEDVDVKSLLSGSLSIVKEKAATQRIHVEIETGEDLGAPRLDMRKTKQIVYNLLSNAIKFTPTGGHVTMRARRVTRSAVGTLGKGWPVHRFPLADNQYQEFLEISVSDTGIGISEANMAKLFQPFIQIDSGLARKFGGTGLGLAMVKQMAELHGGTVALASAEGKGATFAAWLPLREPGDSAVAPPQGAGTMPVTEVGLPSRIALVVEDDDQAAELIRLLLEAEGFAVLRAASAEAALLLAPQQALSLITLDIQLPGIDGWEFLQRIRESSTLARVPVVVISGFGHIDSHMALTRGAAAVLQKPMSRSQLRASLDQLGLHPVPERTHTVMVVDNDPKAVEVIAAFLPAPAYAVVRAYSGSEAIALAQRLRPDLILLDLMMPEVSGFDVVETLLRDPDTARIPILVVTAKQITCEDRAALNPDPDHVIRIIEKSGFDRLRFMAEVRRALSPIDLSD
jgi:PAS domain S-box-containing protein